MPAPGQVPLFKLRCYALFFVLRGKRWGLGKKWRSFFKSGTCLPQFPSCVYHLIGGVTDFVFWVAGKACGRLPATASESICPPQKSKRNFSLNL